MIWVFYLLSLTWRCVTSLCRSIEGSICCPGLYWNKETSACETCPIGYHSINCSEVCSFPSFGIDCQGTCQCNFSLCDPRFGCSRNIYSFTKITTDSSSPSTEKVIRTTPRINRTTHPGKPLVIQGLPLLVTYIIIVFIGLCIVLCGVFVGIHFYKHCIKQISTVDHSFKQQDGYDSLEMGLRQQIDNSSDPTYLDPVSDPRPHYDEIT